MEFNLRAISLSNSVPAYARIEVPEYLGKKIEFRAGISHSLLLPNTEAEFAALPDPGRLLTALDGWARVFRHPHGAQEKIHVVAPTENDAGDLLFQNIELIQPLVRRGAKPAVTIIGGQTMTYEELGIWLVELADAWASNSDLRQRQSVLVRPGVARAELLRLGWVGPEIVDTVPTARRLASIGKVHGAGIISFLPRGFRDIQAKIAGALPLDAVIICRRYVPYVTADAVHASIRRELVHFCDSGDLHALEQQVITWIDLARQTFMADRQQHSPDEDGMLLRLMLRAMLSHAKIGQFKHCQRETVLKCIRARRLNVTIAEKVLDENCEVHEEKKESMAFFLTKDHNDGRRYFLNPSQMETIKLRANFAQ
jgi:hypothetical protein